MRKRKLELHDLRVDSFDTMAAGQEKGTVVGEQDPTRYTGPACVTVCYQTCAATCQEFTCAWTCQESCYLETCELTCPQPCTGNCGR